ncbi:MAG: DNA alkylation repair protein [Spirochaetes bacterium]|nr:DNA alkylation repair protein [Spirochaetota bacterium]
MYSIVGKVREELQRESKEEVRESNRRFFKEEVRLYGVKAPQVERIAKTLFKDIRSEGKTRIFSLCEELLSTGYLEEGFVACHWSYALRLAYEPQDFYVFERWVNRYVTNWAVCDTFCNHTVGAFLETYPEYVKELYRWAKSENRWVRRASAVSLIVPAKRGSYLAEAFFIADLLLLDPEDLVQKGYGWLLKVASLAHPSEVFEFVMNRKARMPRTALRYAIEKMPREWKNRVMAQ